MSSSDELVAGSEEDDGMTEVGSGAAILLEPNARRRRSPTGHGDSDESSSDVSRSNILGRTEGDGGTVVGAPAAAIEEADDQESDAESFISETEVGEVQPSVEASMHSRQKELMRLEARRGPRGRDPKGRDPGERDTKGRDPGEPDPKGRDPGERDLKRRDPRGRDLKGRDPKGRGDARTQASPRRLRTRSPRISVDSPGAGASGGVMGTKATRSSQGTTRKQQSHGRTRPRDGETANGDDVDGKVCQKQEREARRAPGIKSDNTPRTSRDETFSFGGHLPAHRA